MNAAPVTFAHGTALVGPRLDARPFATMSVRDGQVAELDGPVFGDVIDLDGAWVVPGLVDAHVHLDLLAAPSPFVQWEADPVERSRGLIANGLAALAAGTLAVRDLGCVDHAVVQYGRLVSAGRVLGPTVCAAGRFLAAPDGHLWQYARVVVGPDDVRAAVREQAAAGAGVVKVMATGGLTTPGNPGDTELGHDELVAAVEEARAAGLAVAAHAHGPDGIRSAVKAGVVSIEHGALVQADELDLIRAHGVVLVPTLTTVLRLRRGCGIDDEAMDKTEHIRPEFMDNIAHAIEAGVTIAAGTDAGCAHNPVGHVVDELEQYVSLGMPVYDALMAGTLNGGALLGLPGNGSVGVRSPANFLVTEGDPRVDLATLRDPRMIVRAGRVLDLPGIEAAIDALGGRTPALPCADAGGLRAQKGVTT